MAQSMKSWKSALKFSPFTRGFSMEIYTRMAVHCFYFPLVMHFLLGFHLYLIISNGYPQFKSELS